jgi:hypothetical protein
MQQVRRDEAPRGGSGDVIDTMAVYGVLVKQNIIEEFVK